VANVGSANRLLHIRSAILKTSQPSAAKPTPQKSMTDTTAFPFCFLQDAYELCRSTASNKLLRVKSAAKERPAVRRPLLEARPTKRRDVHHSSLTKKGRAVGLRVRVGRTALANARPPRLIVGARLNNPQNIPVLTED
jgi:hypothetical protein